MIGKVIIPVNKIIQNLEMKAIKIDNNSRNITVLDKINLWGMLSIINKSRDRGLKPTLTRKIKKISVNV